MDQNIKEILKQVHLIEIRTRRLATDALAGQFHSMFRGRGMDFEEVREYVPGDEVRTIDWNVTAREGRLFVKKYREERELTIVLAVDVSASGDFGSRGRTKREVEAEIASVLALSAVRNNDKVGLVLFSDQVETYVPPRKGRQHVLRIVREVLSCRPQRRGTDVSHALDFINAVTRRRAMVCVLSDFQSSGDPALALAVLRRSLRMLRRRHDLVALHVKDPRERELLEVGLLTVEDAETGEVIEIDTGSARVRERFAARSREQDERLERALRGESVDNVEVDSSLPYLPVLIALFRSRHRGRRQ
jgi:uncharacterized protein (DUF58 family)